MTREEIDSRRLCLGWGYERLAMRCGLSCHIVRQYLKGRNIANTEWVHARIEKYFESGEELFDGGSKSRCEETAEAAFRLSTVESERKFAAAIRRIGVDYSGRRIA